MRASARRGADRDDSGYTLIEILVVMVIMSMTMVFATDGWLRYQRANELRSGVDEAMAVMRNVQELALSEASTYCISFSSDKRTYTVFKFACTVAAGGTQSGQPQQTPTDRVQITSASFTQPDGTTAATLIFTPRGSATPGSVTLQRQGSTKTYTIKVEGLTGRVSLG